MKNREEQWAIFWCSLLKPIIFDELEGETAHHYMESLSGQEVVMPDGSRRKPALSTLKLKLKQYREGSFSGLYRKSRKDRGKARVIDIAIIEKAVELKKEQPERSEDGINRILKELYGKTISKSTLYRHLKCAGATKQKLGVSKKKVRKRWTRERTHQMWGGDFEKGPWVLVDGEVVATHLSLFIDYHSRYVVEGRYYLSEGLPILIDSLLRAWATHGASAELYLDNGKVYISNALKAACLELNINLQHRPPYDPAAGGLVERIFSTVQSQFESEVRAGDILTLDQLNRAFSAYLSVAYHRRIHSATQQTPEERYCQGRTATRHVDLASVAKFFMEQETRKVDPDFSDVRLYGLLYRVDPRLRSDKVIVKYDPYGDRQTVHIYSLDDQYLGEGTLHKREHGEKVENSPPQGKPEYDYLDLLVEQHARQLKKALEGIDYRNIVVGKQQWPFTSFVQTLARLMGKKGGLSAFNSDQLEELKKLHNRYPGLNRHLLEKVFALAEQKNIIDIAYQLQKLFSGKETQCSSNTSK